MKGGDLGPALKDGVQLCLHRIGHVPGHWVADPCFVDRDSRVAPKLVLTLEHLHAIVLVEASEPVRAPGRVDGDADGSRPRRHRRGDHLGPESNLLVLRTIGVAPHEDVTQMHQGPRKLDGRHQGRHVVAHAFAASFIQGKRSVANSVHGSETRHEFIDVRHLGRPLGADERTHHDGAQSSPRQCVEQFDLGVDTDVGAFDLHPLAHTLFDDDHARKTSRGTHCLARGRHQIVPAFRRAAISSGE